MTEREIRCACGHVAKWSPKPLWNEQKREWFRSDTVEELSCDNRECEWDVVYTRPVLSKLDCDCDLPHVTDGKYEPARKP